MLSYHLSYIFRAMESLTLLSLCSHFQIEASRNGETCSLDWRNKPWKGPGWLSSPGRKQSNPIITNSPMQASYLISTNMQTHVTGLCTILRDKNKTVETSLGSGPQPTATKLHHSLFEPFCIFLILTMRSYLKCSAARKCGENRNPPLDETTSNHRLAINVV